jgi:hypothetical protein
MNCRFHVQGHAFNKRELNYYFSFFESADAVLVLYFFNVIEKDREIFFFSTNFYPL